MNSTRRLMEELSELIPSSNKDDFLKSKVNHLVESFGNIAELIDKNFDDEGAAHLKRSLINAIRCNDSLKFNRALNRMRKQ